MIYRLTEEPAPAIRAELYHVRRRPRGLFDDVSLAMPDDMPPPVKWQEVRV